MRFPFPAPVRHEHALMTTFTLWQMSAAINDFFTGTHVSGLAGGGLCRVRELVEKRGASKP
jgi:hypothetical protein